MFEQVNEVAVLVTAILSSAIGSIWYSPLVFGSAWMRSADLTMGLDGISQKGLIRSVGKTIVVQSIFFFVIALFFSEQQNAGMSLLAVGFFLTLLLSSVVAGSVIWEKHSMTYFFIHIGYIAISVFGGITILSFWPW
ncbi:MAG: DUF1761 domain-containing protein [Candidatus Pacebacteria bacterium]|nr:DUF1761 domain-containing protein [Candidatus Paceibacterota bacterium]MCF7857671.1 DUF1761 domain-containing protein [Candidatus Paceibacterota bacterium]